MRWRGALIVLGAVVVAACATTDDPSRGGFVSGVQGLSSGAYEERIREREANLERMRALQQDLEQESSELEALKRQRQQQLADERRKLEALDRDTRALEQRLVDLEAEQGASDRRLPELQRRLQDLQARLAQQQRAVDSLEGSAGGADALEGSDSGGADLRRRQLESQRAALQREYEELLNLTLMLAQ